MESFALDDEEVDDDDDDDDYDVEEDEYGEDDGDDDDDDAAELAAALNVRQRSVENDETHRQMILEDFTKWLQQEPEKVVMTHPILFF